jgi:uncharacterized protein (TIGR02588 family)
MAEIRETLHQPQQTAHEATANEAPPDANSADSIPFWEWVVAYVGLVLVLGSIGFMFYQAIAGDPSPPHVTVRTEAIKTLSHGYLVQIRAINQGGSAAANVSIAGVLTNHSGPVEVSETILDYVPARSYRQGGLFFTHDPQQFHMQLRAMGYTEP